MPKNLNWSLILASQSPRRKELLGWTQVPFSILVAHTSEDSEAQDPADYVTEIAKHKASATLALVKTDLPFMIVGADTTVAYQNKKLGKPRDRDDAREMLKMLSGQTHEVFTGVSLVWKTETGVGEFSFYEKSSVTFYPLTDVLLENYLASQDPLDKAGSYGIQGQALTFIRSMAGDYANVVGFPLGKFCDIMENTIAPQLGWTLPWQKVFGSR